MGNTKRGGGMLVMSVDGAPNVFGVARTTPRKWREGKAERMWLPLVLDLEARPTNR